MSLETIANMEEWFSNKVFEDRWEFYIEYARMTGNYVEGIQRVFFLEECEDGFRMDMERYRTWMDSTQYY